MKIISNMSKTFFKNFNEAKGVALNKKRILKKKTSISLTYLSFVLLTILTLLIFLFISYYTNNTNLLIAISIILFIYIFYAVARTMISYNFRKKQNYMNTIILSEEGLTDKSFYGIKITLSWEKIKAIVIKKYTITILTDTNLYFFFDIKEKDRIMEATEKYGKNTLIIK